MDGRRVPLLRQEVSHRVDKHPRGRLTADQQMAVALQTEELRVRNGCGDVTASPDRDPTIAQRMDHESRHGDLREAVTHIDIAECRQKARRIFRRRRAPLKLVEPVELLDRRARHERRGKDLPVGGVVLPPTGLRERDDGLALLHDFRCRVDPPARGIGAEQDQPSDALWVSHGVFDRDRAAL